MASGAVCCCASVAALQNFTWAASAMQRALAAIQAGEMACYASLNAPLMLFFARHASPLRSRRLCADFGSRSFRIILCDTPTTRTAYASSGRVQLQSNSCGALAAKFVREQMALTSVGRGFGLALRSVSAARNTHTTILELPLQR